MIELFVENKQADINEGFSALLTFAIDDIRDFAAKNTTFSKTIILPGTKRNNALFGNIFEVSSGNSYDSTSKNVGVNFNAAISARAYIFSDNIQIFKGVIRLLEIVIDEEFVEYEVAVFGELGGFASKLGNLKLEDLDFSAYDHVYSVSNIANSWDNTTGAGYYYPLLDLGNYSTDKHNWKVKTFRPALFVKEYVDKIFSSAGYTYDCPLFSTGRFRGLIVPHNQKTLTNKSAKLLNASRERSQTVISDSFSAEGKLTFPFFSGALFTPVGSPSERFTYNGTDAVNVTLTYSFDYSFKTTNNTILLSLRKNGVTIARKTLPDIGGMTISGYWDNTINITLAQNDYLEFYATVSDSTLGNYYSFVFKSASLVIDSSAEIPVPVNVGDTIKANYLIPKNILQKDFFSSIVKLFNLYVYEDPQNERVLKISPFVEFFTGDVVDWSGKIDRSQPIKVKPMSELNARYYEYKFKDDSDYYNDLYKKRYNKGYGSYIYDSQFEFAKETEKVELIFSGTPLVGYAGEDKVYSTIFKLNAPDDAAKKSEENIDFNIRVLQSKKITGVTSWNILADDGTTVLGTYSSYGYAGHFDDPDAPGDDINFGVTNELFYTLSSGALNVNQFNIYWSSYMAEITDKDSRLLTANFRLRYKDIYNLDFGSFVFLDGNLYRLNKVSDFNATKEDLCSVELLKVVNATYNTKPVPVTDYVDSGYVLEGYV